MLNFRQNAKVDSKKKNTIFLEENLKEIDKCFVTYCTFSI